MVRLGDRNQEQRRDADRPQEARRDQLPEPLIVEHEILLHVERAGSATEPERVVGQFEDRAVVVGAAGDARDPRRSVRRAPATYREARGRSLASRRVRRWRQRPAEPHTWPPYEEEPERMIAMLTTALRDTESNPDPTRTAVQIHRSCRSDRVRRHERIMGGHSAEHRHQHAELDRVQRRAVDTGHHRPLLDREQVEIRVVVRAVEGDTSGRSRGRTGCRQRTRRTGRARRSA